MKKITTKKYKQYIKEQRVKYFEQPYQYVYDIFVELGFDKVGKVEFIKNASALIEQLRLNCWNKYLPIEKQFTSEMLKILINDLNINDHDVVSAICTFVENYSDYIYALSLSNTQSRRSRAGKEFEAIIELILMGSGIRLDSQGNVGTQEFLSKGLGKMVDVVSPGVVEYIVNKRNAVLISAKTTLRERWQEVPEEMGRTGAREMFLATLDESISNDVLNTLYEANVQVTTTKRIKETKYKDNHRVLTFEDLIEICLNNESKWNGFNHTLENKKIINEMINKQIDKHAEHKFVKDFYIEQLGKEK
ncbi:type II restriction endonuclease [Mycoplasma simbae]|uniref:type II restriction endonuclease n=1 Tax=Mycoplasma simbae TaxID=36744 RepID=UPI000497233C|nr:type II restriction endonuclease [Mycoplasma simbae]